MPPASKLADISTLVALCRITHSMNRFPLDVRDVLPLDADARLLGRVWCDAQRGPCPVLIDGTTLRDLSSVTPLMSELLERDDLDDLWRSAGQLPSLGDLSDYAPFADDARALGRLLSPIDLQAIKAAGVTFAASMLERVVEEQARGDASQAELIRARLSTAIGDNLRDVQAGSDKAQSVKKLLQEMNLWSQYLEVGIGPDAEIFTKSQPMSSVGVGAAIGIHPMSEWNNPEPEVVLVVDSRGRIRGATLGNDVNLRDVEGRSALLLGRAKDNNASCAIGPFIRLFDGRFTLASIDQITVALEVRGPDGFSMRGESPLSAISRTPADLVRQTLSASHQYPDGLVLFVGTMFAPTMDRGAPGAGFTHQVGDQVKISADALGALINTVDRCDAIAPWTFGTTALIRNLVLRRLIG